MRGVRPHEDILNSCRNRHCPECQFLRKEKWVEARGREPLISYFHVVFTLPDETKSLALRNRKIVFDMLLKRRPGRSPSLTGKRLGRVIAFVLSHRLRLQRRRGGVLWLLSRPQSFAA